MNASRVPVKMVECASTMLAPIIAIALMALLDAIVNIHLPFKRVLEGKMKNFHRTSVNRDLLGLRRTARSITAPVILVKIRVPAAILKTDLPALAYRVLKVRAFFSILDFVFVCVLLVSFFIWDFVWLDFRVHLVEVIFFS